MRIQYPLFPVGWEFLVGLFDACYRFHRKDGSIVLICDHLAPLRIIQNWFPGKINEENDTFRMTLHGAPANVLLAIVGPQSKHGISYDGQHQSFELRFVPVTDASQLQDDDAYMIGFYYANVGKVSSAKQTFSYPFPDMDDCRRVSVVRRSDEVEMLLNSGIMFLQYTLGYTLPDLPEKLMYKSPIALRNRLCTIAAEKLSTEKRYRRAALTLEQQELIDTFGPQIGVQGICNLLGVSPSMVRQYVIHQGVSVRKTRDVIADELKQGKDLGWDRDKMRLHIKTFFGYEMSVEAVSARLYRNTKCDIGP